MADLKPLGSEKLTGDEKLKRILELTYYNNNKKTSEKKAELVKESTSGGVYGIVKEKDGYYVKRGLNESSLDYIGGMFMKNKNRFSSYAEAYKRLNLLQGQEELQEATKYVLKQNKPQEEAPAAEPSIDAAPPAPPAGSPAPAPEAPSDLPPADASVGDTAPSDEAPSGDSVSPEDPKRSDYMSEVQKYAGKLGQELRDQHERMESDDIKYVLNMIISAVDLDKLSDEDIEEIGKKFGRDEESGEESGSEEPSGEEEAPAPEEAPEEVSEEDSMKALDEFINSPVPSENNEEVDLSSYVDQADEDVDFAKHSDLGEMDEEKELDLDEIKNSINQAVGETLSKYFN